MDVRQLEANVEIVQTLGNHPNQEDGLSPEELKAKFDEAPKIIKDYINTVIVPALQSAPKVLEVTVGEVSSDLVSSHTTQEIWDFCNAGGYVYAKFPSGDIYPLLKATESKAWFIGSGADGLLRSYYIDINDVMLHDAGAFAPLDDKSDSDVRTLSAAKILSMIAQGGTEDIDMGERKILASKVLVGNPTDPRVEISYDRTSGALVFTDVKSGAPVHLKVEGGINPADAVNRGQLDTAMKNVAKTLFVGQIEGKTTCTTEEICSHIERGGVVLLNSPVGYLPLIGISRNNGAVFAYYSNTTLTIYIVNDACVTTKTIELDKISRIQEIEQVVETKATINNNEIGADAWSSENIVNKVCSSFEKSGSVVQCEPVEGYPLGVVAQIKFTQEGEGDPSPDNVRPITGHSGVVLKHCGKNFYDKDTFPLTVGQYVKNGGDLTSYSPTSKYACTKGFIPVAHLQGKTITLNHPPQETDGSNPKMIFYRAAEESSVIPGKHTSGYTIEVPSDAKFMRFSTPKAYADGTQIQIEIGSVATGHEQYKPVKPISIAFGGTIYKGEFDFATGLLRVTHKGVAMSELEWEENQENAYYFATLPAAAALELKTDDACCNVFYHGADNYDDIIQGAVTAGRVFAIEGTEIVVVPHVTFDEFMPYLEEVGALVVYKLQMPEILRLDAHQVTALQGLNTLYGNTGVVKVKGKNDPDALVNSLLYRIEKLEAAAVNNT